MIQSLNHIQNICIRHFLTDFVKVSLQVIKGREQNLNLLSPASSVPRQGNPHEAVAEPFPHPFSESCLTAEKKVSQFNMAV